MGSLGGHKDGPGESWGGRDFFTGEELGDSLGSAPGDDSLVQGWARGSLAAQIAGRHGRR